MAIDLNKTYVVQPTTPVNGGAGTAAVDTLAEKLALYTWKPFVPPVSTGTLTSDGDTRVSTGTSLATIVAGLAKI